MKPAKSSPVRVKCGPQLGAPPSLEQHPLDRLNVDPAYQRATDGPRSRQLIARMVKEWNWALCQPLVVARRADGSLWILDGQHRHTGARERGDIPFLPCVVQSSLDVAGEARTFVQLNTERQKLTQAEVFHGQLAAGDPNARAVQQLLDDTGWKVVRHNNTASYRAGELECAPMMVKVLAFRGQDTVRFALTTLRAAYPNKTVRVAATLLKGLFDVFGLMDAKEFTVARLIAAIGAVEPNDWITRATILRERNPAWSTTMGVAQAMIAAARGDAFSRPAPIAAPPARPTPAARPAPVAPSAKSGPVFGTSGKGWCDQCQQLRTREAARACTDRFCKLRASA